MRARAKNVTRRTARRLTSHWVFVSIILTIIALGLTVSSPFRGLTGKTYTDVQVGVRGQNNQVPKQVSSNTGGSAIGSSNGQLTLLKPLPKHVALTFDDGPDPQWTPAIEKVLKKHGVNATFFVIGSEVVRHPGEVRSLVNNGNEIGSHTFTHANIANATPARVDVELGMTEVAIEGATGHSSSLLRPPYSAGPDAVTNRDWGVETRLARDGYLTVLTTVDTEDWKKFNLQDTLDKFDPDSGRGEVVLMHDGGGNRAKTAEYLDQLIPALQKQGYQIGTVSQAFGLKNATEPVSGWKRVFSTVFVYGLWFCSLVVSWVGWFALIAGTIAALRAALLLIASTRHRQLVHTRPALKTDDPVTVIVPAYNEEAGIAATLQSLMRSTQPVKVIVVDDGSTDRTSQIVRELDLPQVQLIVQENAGKAAALNTGIAATTTELVVMVDGDTVFEPHSIEKLIEPFADDRVGAVSGNAKVENRGGLLGRWQHIEYVIGFNMDRRMYDVAECMPTVPGAIGGFRTAAVRAVGGLGTDTLAEDTDLTMALGSSGWLVRYAPEAIARTEAPNTLRALWKQRYRWSYGTMQAMWKHRSGLTDRGIRGRYLRRSLVYMSLFQVLLPAVAPAIDLFTIYGVLSGDARRMITAWVIFQAIDLTIGIVAFRADKEKLRPLWALPLTQLCYRQMMYLVVVQSIAQVVTGRRLAWQRMERYGTHQSGGATAVTE